MADFQTFVDVITFDQIKEVEREWVEYSHEAGLVQWTDDYLEAKDRFMTKSMLDLQE